MMSRLKDVKYFLVKRNLDWMNRPIGFTMLPAIWPEKPSRRRTSSKGVDNLHRLYKEFRRILPYGTIMKTTDVGGRVRFYAPPGFGFLSPKLPFSAPKSLGADLVDHYATVHDRLARVSRMSLTELGL